VKAEGTNPLLSHPCAELKQQRGRIITRTKRKKGTKTPKRGIRMLLQSTEQDTQQVKIKERE